MKIRQITRRNFVKAITGSSIAATTAFLGACSEDNQTSNAQSDTAFAFNHGIASGDPLSDAVIIWTRITPEKEGTYTGSWEVAEDEQFSNIAANGEFTTNAASDYTIKIDVTGLVANSQYYYRFLINGIASETGITKTLPDSAIDNVNLAVFSCANHPAGYFHVYAEAAKRNDIDFVIHLGDYIYEYGIDTYSSDELEATGRKPFPEHELKTLNDYRTRYAQYRLDNDLQSLHAKHPFICVWDDHEFVNNLYITGALNHDLETDGHFLTRRANALKAYYEWLPIRQQNPKRPQEIYRSFVFGDLFSLHMLDTRMIGREKQLDYSNYMDSATQPFDLVGFQADVNNPERQLLGEKQTSWLQEKMIQSTTTWQILGQQVLMGRMELPSPVVLRQISINDYAQLFLKASTLPDQLTEQEKAILAQPSIPYNLDAWDGYAGNREIIYETALTSDKNLVVLSGDTHNAWANNLLDAQENQIGVEFAVSSVSSPGLERILQSNPNQVSATLPQFIDSLKYSNLKNHGFMLVRISHTEVQNEWHYIDTVKKQTYTPLSNETKILKVLPGAGNRTLLDID